MESFGLKSNNAIRHAFKSLEPNKRKIKLHPYPELEVSIETRFCSTLFERNFPPREMASSGNQKHFAC